MLRARADSAEDQRDHQNRQAWAEPGEQITSSCEGCAGGENPGGAEPFGQQRRGDLERGHRPGIERAQHADRCVGQAELRLPDRQ